MSHTHSTKRLLSVGAIAVMGALAFTSCSSGGGTADTDGYGEFEYLSAVENAIVRDEIATLAEGVCAEENEQMPFTVETLPQNDVTTRVTLLASQDSLPSMFTAPTAPLRPGGALGDDDIVVNFEEALTELGVIDDILPSAIAAVKNIYGDRFVSLPYQFNFEGVFYNKELFDEHGIEVPETWADMLAAADELEAAGVAPFTLPGSQTWMITRWISGYLFRDLGPDAIQKVLDGEAKFTDPEYVEAFAAIQDLGTYFGAGVSTMDMQTSVNEFLSGNAAMMYNGTWFLADIYNEDVNQIGADAVGFMSIPAVTGGAGSIDQYPANAGAATSMSAELYNEGAADWLTCIAENYGSSAMENQGVISGFRLNEEVSDVPALTSEIQDIMSETEVTLTWLEAFLPEKAAGEAGTNAGPLLTGSMSPEDYAAALQAGMDAS